MDQKQRRTDHLPMLSYPDSATEILLAAANHPE